MQFQYRIRKLFFKLFAALVLSSGIVCVALFSGAFLTSAGLFVAMAAFVWPDSRVGEYGFQVWIAFDKLCNAALGGSHKETISSRLGKSLYYDHDNVFYFLIIDQLIAELLDIVDPDHCYHSIDWRVGSQKNQPPETW